MGKIDFSEYKFRCSSIGKIMTDSRTKEPLGETAKAHLVDCWIREKYARDNEIVSQFLEKGNQVEEEAITIYSSQKHKFYKKNSEILDNEYITGTPDIFEGPEIRKAVAIKDIKAPWSIWTFYQNLYKPINKDYYWQLQGYQAISGAKEAGLVYVLVSTPEKLIEDEINRKKWEWPSMDPLSDPAFNQLADYLRTTMRYEDIPESERWMEFEVNRDDNEIDRVYERVKLCRKFMNSLP